jgi:hypothetical protein
MPEGELQRESGRGHPQKLATLEFFSVFLQHSVEVFDLGFQVCSWKPKENARRYYMTLRSEFQNFTYRTTQRFCHRQWDQLGTIRIGYPAALSGSGESGRGNRAHAASSHRIHSFNCAMSLSKILI